MKKREKEREKERKRRGGGQLNFFYYRAIEIITLKKFDDWYK